MQRIIILILASLMLVVPLSACSAGAEDAPAKPPEPKELTRAELVERVRPSVAKVFAKNALGDGSGSAITIDAEKGLLITNQHVVEGASDVQVKYTGGTKISAKVVGQSASPDLAVLKLKHVPEGLKAVPFAAGEGEIGDSVMTLGFAGSIRRWNVAQARASFGFIDDKDIRNPDLGPATCPQGNLMMTSAAINPGMSGGGIFNDKGEVVAIITYTNSETDQGYGIQTDVVRQALPDLMAGKMGTGLQTIPVSTLDMGYVASLFWGDVLTRQQLDTLGRIYSSQRGLFVVGALGGSDADRKGFKFGDIIWYMNDVEVNNATQHCRVVDSSDVVKMSGWSMSEGIDPHDHGFTRRVRVK